MLHYNKVCHSFYKSNIYKIITTSTKTLFFYRYQSNLQFQQKLYYSLFLPPLTNNPAPLIPLLYFKKLPAFLSLLQLLRLQISLTPHSKPCLADLIEYRTKTMQNFTNNMKNRLISNRRHFSSHRIPICSKKQLPIFHQNN